MEPLDRPVWSALTSGWAWLAEGDGRAWRQDRRYGPFAAARDGSVEAQMALAALVPPGESLWLVEPETITPPTGCIVRREAAVAQMVRHGAPAELDRSGILTLGEADAAEMRTLAALTRPGPFHRCTYISGRFVGIRVGGRLAAMAGERMRLPAHAEVSGVCTHPDFRGRGYAARLMSMVAARIAARGEAAVLHTYADNRSAIGLYERLGFEPRAELLIVEIAAA